MTLSNMQKKKCKIDCPTFNYIKIYSFLLTIGTFKISTRYCLDGSRVPLVYTRITGWEPLRDAKMSPDLTARCKR